MAIKHIDIGAAPILWSNVKHAVDEINDNFNNITLNDLADVNTDNGIISVGEVLAWDGIRWEASNAAGVGANAGIGWTIDGANDQLRVSSTFNELNDEYNIRTVRINPNGLLEIEIATFSPEVAAENQILAWDQPATHFTVNVDNPTDFASRYIKYVGAITNNNGFHPVLADYAAEAQSQVPAGGIDWTQTFDTTGVASISSNGTGLAGGNASADIVFYDDNDEAWNNYGTINISWQNASTNINFNNLVGQHFLGKYNTIGYNVNISGINDINNNTITILIPTGGDVSNNGGGGTMTFNTPLHKNNNDNSRIIYLNTEFFRSDDVTGSMYSVIASDSAENINANFTYPSFYIWTTNSSTVPTRNNIITGNDFAAGVTELGNHTKDISTFITNADVDPRCFWFAVRTDTTQPTVFETGPTSTLLSTVSVTIGNFIDLEPDIPDPGYIAENYTLYGITLQPGDTYVRIN